MSVDDKLKLIGGVDGFYTPGNPSIALKRLKNVEDPSVCALGLAPAYTAGVALAATWTRVGRTLGASLGDTPAHWRNFCCPSVNSIAPIERRNMEYFGEDPSSPHASLWDTSKVFKQGSLCNRFKTFAGNNSE